MAPTAMIVIAVIWVQACSTEKVTEVIVASVSVRPVSALAVEGGEVAFDAIVVDENGNTLEGADVTWASDAPYVVSVDEDGVAHALSDGDASIEAWFQGMVGRATVTVLPGSDLELEPALLSLSAGAGGENPPLASVRLDNGGNGALTGLEAEVEYPFGEAGDWLAAELSAGVTPATLTLTSRVDGLPAGRYTATVLLTANEIPHLPASLPVTLLLTGFSLTQSGGGTSVSEEGGTDDLEVVLDVQPEGDVVLAVSSSNALEARVEPEQLTFTPGNWALPQAVTVHGVDDRRADGDQVSQVTVSVRVDASAESYRPAVARTVDVTNDDDDGAGVTVSQSGGSTQVAEASGVDELSVVLTAQPATAVVVAVSTGDAGEVTPNVQTLGFSPDRWDQPQSVVLTGVDDVVLDGDQTSAVSLSVVDAGSDPAFRGLPPQVVDVTTLDDEVAGLTLAESAARTFAAEGGSTDSFTVALDAQPLGDVVLAVTSDDAADALVAPATIRFTPAVWNAPQAVTVAAVDDAVVDGSRARTVTVAVDDGGSVEGFAGLSRTLGATTVDNDVAGLVIQQTQGTTLVAEGGATDTLVVALTAQPLGSVVVAVSSDNTADVVGSPGALTFTSASWSVPQRVTVTAVDDLVIDGIGFSTLTLAVTPSSDAAFQGLSQTVRATSFDNDLLGVASARVEPARPERP